MESNSVPPVHRNGRGLFRVSTGEPEGDVAQKLEVGLTSLACTRSEISDFCYICWALRFGRCIGRA